jgi:hypothetical protein
VYLAYRRSAESCVQPVAVEVLDVRRVEFLKLQRSENWLDVIVDKVGVSIVGALAHGAVHRSLEPYIQVFADGDVLIAVHDAISAVG